jgi:hypothetical protein
MMEVAGKQMFMMVEVNELQAMKNDIAEIKQLLKQGKMEKGSKKKLTHKEAAAFLKIHKETLTRRIARGDYPKEIQHNDAGFNVYFEDELLEKCFDYKKTK